jgi:hypothetical protein
MSMKQPPESEVAEFLSQVDRLAALLDAEEETFWRGRIAAAASKVRNSNWQGFSDFLSGYGTSGSFNECSIRTGEWQGNNHVWNADDKSRYQEFEDLKSSAYVLAHDLAHSTERTIGGALACAYRFAPIRTKALLWLMLVLLLGAFVLGRP